MDQSLQTVIRPKVNLFALDLKSLWRSKDLIWLFVVRDFSSIYKQTIMGPLWLIIQPLMSSVMFTFVFGRIIKIPVDGVPYILFFLSGIMTWSYFSDCFLKTSNVFTANQAIFGKVYFPRMVVPLSITISNLLKFSIQFIVFLCFWLYYLKSTDIIVPNWTALLLPIYIFTLALLGLAFGIIFSSLTYKYKDLSYLTGFGLQLLMYSSAVIYPIAIVPEPLKRILMYNPVVHIITAFRYSFLGRGEFPGFGLIYSITFAIVLFILGYILFNQSEKNFIDTV